MAPEQVRGEAVDARADIFAFGAVLYEMVTGQRAFARTTAAETMTAILREDPPPLSASSATLPPALDRIVRHCLEKNPAERFERARDLAFALETLTTPEVASGGTVTTPAGMTAPRKRGWIAAAVAVGVVGLAALTWWATTRPRPAAASAVVIGTATQLTVDDGLEIDAAISPDGRVVAYAAGNAATLRIYLRPVIGGRTIPLSDSAAALEFQPRWSPDGSQILFLRPDGVFVASSYGGTARRVAAGAVLDGEITGAAWAPDGNRVLIARAGGRLSVVSLDGRDDRPVGTFAADVYACDWATTGLIACASGNLLAVVPGNAFGNIAPSTIVVGREGQPFIEVTDRLVLNHSPTWSGDGQWLYFVSNRQGPSDVYALAFRDGRAAGEPQRITTGSGAHSVSLSHSSGQLAYVSYTSKSNLWSLPIPRSGVVDISAAEQITRGNQMIEAMHVAPDGKSILFDWTLHQNSDVFRKTLGDDSEPQRLTSDRLDNFAPVFSPDQSTIAYHAFVDGIRQIFVMPAHGGDAQQITRDQNHHAYPVWSADGEAIAFINTGTPATRRGYYVIRRAGDAGWGNPVQLGDGLPGRRAAWIDSDTIALPLNRGIERVAVGSRQATTLYAPNVDGDPVPESLQLSEDGRTLYFKAHDDKGMAQIWALPVEGGPPKLVVKFTDPTRPSIRADFAAGAGRFFFTLEDRQADVWIADFTRK
jgi:Tol biopolymer transport system component